MTACRPLLGTLALVVACNTAPVLPPEDDRTIELVETQLWSGGEVRAVVRHAEAEEAPVAITLDGEALVVTRVDDTTFSATLPVHTGTLPVRVERDDLDALEASVTLHGYFAKQSGPSMAGPVVLRPGAGAPVVLGSTREGPAEVSLYTGLALRTWPVSMHSLRCGVGVVPGPTLGKVLVRGQDVDGACRLPHTIREYSIQGLSASGTEVPPLTAAGISAVVGPSTVVVGWHDNWSWYIQCASTPLWSDCTSGFGQSQNNHTANPRGWVAGYQAGRIFPLGIKSALYDLATGDIVTILPHQDTDLLAYSSAVFSGGEDTLYVASVRFINENGKLLLLASSTGDVITEVAVEGGQPIALALDAARRRLLVLMHHFSDRRLWVRVLDTADHEIVAELAIPDAAVEATVRGHEHQQLVLAEQGSVLLLVSTAYVPNFSSSVPPPMLIARWTLPPE